MGMVVIVIVIVIFIFVFKLTMSTITSRLNNILTNGHR